MTAAFAISTKCQSSSTIIFMWSVHHGKKLIRSVVKIFVENTERIHTSSVRNWLKLTCHVRVDLVTVLLVNFQKLILIFILHYFFRVLTNIVPFLSMNALCVVTKMIFLISAYSGVMEPVSCLTKHRIILDKRMETHSELFVKNNIK